MAFQKLRVTKHASVSRRYKEGRAYASDQGEVWDEVAMCMDQQRAESPSEAMADMYRQTREQTIDYLERLGPKACFLSWLPLVGDPLCAVAGWLRMPFWPCTGYMLIGKFLRYLCMTTVLLWMFPH